MAVTVQTDLDDKIFISMPRSSREDCGMIKDWFQLRKLGAQIRAQLWAWIFWKIHDWCFSTTTTNHDDQHHAEWWGFWEGGAIDQRIAPSHSLTGPWLEERLLQFVCSQRQTLQVISTTERSLWQSLISAVLHASLMRYCNGQCNVALTSALASAAQNQVDWGGACHLLFWIHWKSPCINFFFFFQTIAFLLEFHKENSVTTWSPLTIRYHRLCFLPVTPISPPELQN